MSEEISPKAAPQNAHRLPLILVAAIVLFSVSAGFFGGLLGAKSHYVNSSTSSSTQKTIVDSQSNLISSIATDVGPSVVSVNVTGQAAASSQSSFFGDSGSATQQSAGTGFFVSADGLIVTNRHVVPAGTTSVNIVLADGTQLNDVNVVGRTSSSDPLDIAFLKVTDAKGHKFKPVTLGDSSKMKVGDMVVAIGNALGQFQNTVTSGIISGHGRSVEAGDEDLNSATESLQDLFQTDAAINQGNSGGPLVNSDGQVIGINTAVAGDAQNISFAIPIADVNNIIQGVIKTGKLSRPYLGVQYLAITPDVVSHYNLSVDHGAYLGVTQNGSGIIAGSPAAKAGLKEGDIITKVNDTVLDDNNTLSTVLGRHNVGEQVSFTVVRGGKTITIKATLDSAPTN